MPLHHARETYLSPGRLTETLQALGIGGVVYPGALAWDCWPQAANPTTVTPNAADETDGAAATLIAAAAVSYPYYVVGFPLRSGAAGNFQIRFKLQNSTPTIFRVIRTYNDRSTGPNAGIRAPGFPPIPIAGGLGFQAIVATHPGAGPAYQAYAHILNQASVKVVPDISAVASSNNGNTFPDLESSILGTQLFTSGTTAWIYGDWVEITPGIDTPCLITGIWGNIEGSTNHVQATYATGPSGGEVEWATLGWPAPQGSDDADARHNLTPFPFYLPANTRLAAKARCSGSTLITFDTAVEYIPLPLR